MDVNEVLAWADKLVFAKTGAHLNSLQQAILAGAWDSQKYRDIAEDYHCSEPNVKRVAASLWKLISDELDEKIDKKNFRATMERFYISKSKIQNFVQSNFNQGEIKFCGESWHSDNTGKLRSPSANSSTNSPSKQPEQRHNLTEAPEWEHHNNRRAEITTLKKWILDEKIRVVTIFGLPGMGKTTLARELVEQIKDNFDYILWRNCSETLTLKSFQTNLIEFFSQNQETKSSSLIDYLRLNRCLIILDDFQELFAPEKFAGTYLPEAESYGKFLKEMARSPHKSCFLILSWEKPTEIATLEGENRHCRSLQMGGLREAAAGEILSNKGLKDDDKWGELIQIYSGNPSWLNIVAATIEDLFNRSVDRFLSYPTLFLGDLEPRLQEYYQRLSASEKIVIQWLVNQEAADIFQKPVGANGHSPLPDADFLTAIQSLRKRGLIEKVSDNNGASLLTVQGLFKQYVKNQ
ncbi:NB-ARC domain-containing protein [Planktothricoides raciborskii]|uniref:NACHT domain-containing protein n=1 Tax=Planktothricoides raciborskii FACHB-1370 TaxID=2949576 RepID=A0ABR8E8E4_9CYAN|nr:NB-ARC domain-containing protein [Planktothricoides raciborskii]MBD2542978.1 NACHT domain-containing protein [Planktothricoides raciborskii FACHB-1370]MBD2581856.1 NACHT domain-containing protein [Planktothricoides raciborskii FACHB-1261]